MNKQRNRAVFIGLMMLMALIIAYFKARFIDATAAREVLCYGSMGLLLSAQIAVMKLRKKVLAVKISYLVSVVLMFLLKTPLGVSTNGVVRWLGYNEICLVRPANLLLVSTILFIAITSQKLSWEQEWKVVLLRNIPCAVTLWLFIVFDSYWDVIAYLIIIIFFFAVWSRNNKQILTSYLIAMSGILGVAYSNRWNRGTGGIVRKMRLDAILSGGLLGSDSEIFSFINHPAEAITVFAQRLGWIGLFFIVILFIIFSLYIFETRKTAKENRDRFGWILSTAIGIHFLVATIIPLFTSFFLSTTAPFLLLDHYRIDILVFFVEAGLVQSICVKKVLKKHKNYGMLIVLVISIGVISIFEIQLNFKREFYKETYGEYAEFIENKKYENVLGKAEKYWYEFAYLNSDDSPELFMSTGDARPNMVYIFTYIRETESIEHIGCFGQISTVWINEKDSLLKSQYGGMGAFVDVYSEMGKDGSMNVIATRAIDGHDANQRFIYFASFPLPDVWNDLTGYHPCDWEAISNYKVSEEEYEKINGKKEYRVINISTMDTVVHFGGIQENRLQ